MKKFLTVLVAALLGVGAYAQDWYVGGSFALSGTKDSGFGIAIAPDFGYCISDNLNVGAIIGFGNANAAFSSALAGDGSYTLGETSWEFCPYLRYIPFSQGIVSFFTDACVDVYGGKDSLGDSYSGLVVGINPGLSIELSDNFSVDFTLGLIGYDTELQTFGLSVGRVSSIGFYYAF